MTPDHLDDLGNACLVVDHQQLFCHERLPSDAASSAATPTAWLSTYSHTIGEIAAKKYDSVLLRREIFCGYLSGELIAAKMMLYSLAIEIISPF